MSEDTQGKYIAFFSTDGGQHPPRSASSNDVSIIVRSNPTIDAEQLIKSLRARWPHVCFGIFAPWQVYWFFDEYDFRLQGGRFLYEHVLQRMQKENETELSRYCKKWSDTNKEQFHVLNVLPIDKLFHQDDLKKYGEGFLEKAKEAMCSAYDRAAQFEFKKLESGLPVGNFANEMQSPRAMAPLRNPSAEFNKVKGRDTHPNQIYTISNPPQLQIPQRRNATNVGRSPLHNQVQTVQSPFATFTPGQQAFQPSHPGLIGNEVMPGVLGPTAPCMVIPSAGHGYMPFPGLPLYQPMTGDVQANPVGNPSDAHPHGGQTGPFLPTSQNLHEGLAEQKVRNSEVYSTDGAHGCSPTSPMFPGNTFKPGERSFRGNYGRGRARGRTYGSRRSSNGHSKGFDDPTLANSPEDKKTARPRKGSSRRNTIDKNLGNIGVLPVTQESQEYSIQQKNRSNNRSSDIDEKLSSNKLISGDIVPTQQPQTPTKPPSGQASFSPQQKSLDKVPHSRLVTIDYIGPEINHVVSLFVKGAGKMPDEEAIRTRYQDIVPVKHVTIRPTFAKSQLPLVFIELDCTEDARKLLAKTRDWSDLKVETCVRDRTHRYTTSPFKREAPLTKHDGPSPSINEIHASPAKRGGESMPQRRSHADSVSIRNNIYSPQDARSSLEIVQAPPEPPKPKQKTWADIASQPKATTPTTPTDTVAKPGDAPGRNQRKEADTKPAINIPMVTADSPPADMKSTPPNLPPAPPTQSSQARSSRRTSNSKDHNKPSASPGQPRRNTGKSRKPKALKENIPQANSSENQLPHRRPSTDSSSSRGHSLKSHSAHINHDDIAAVEESHDTTTQPITTSTDSEQAPLSVSSKLMMTDHDVPFKVFSSTRPPTSQCPSPTLEFHEPNANDAVEVTDTKDGTHIAATATQGSSLPGFEQEANPSVEKHDDDEVTMTEGITSLHSPVLDSQSGGCEDILTGNQDTEHQRATAEFHDSRNFEQSHSPTIQSLEDRASSSMIGDTALPFSPTKEVRRSVSGPSVGNNGLQDWKLEYDEVSWLLSELKDDEKRKKAWSDELIKIKSGLEEAETIVCEEDDKLLAQPGKTVRAKARKRRTKAVDSHKIRYDDLIMLLEPVRYAHKTQIEQRHSQAYTLKGENLPKAESIETFQPQRRRPPQILDYSPGALSISQQLKFTQQGPNLIDLAATLSRPNPGVQCLITQNSEYEHESLQTMKGKKRGLDDSDDRDELIEGDSHGGVFRYIKPSDELAEHGHRIQYDRDQSSSMQTPIRPDERVTDVTDEDQQHYEKPIDEKPTSESLPHSDSKDAKILDAAPSEAFSTSSGQPTQGILNLDESGPHGSFQSQEIVGGSDTSSTSTLKSDSEPRNHWQTPTAKLSEAQEAGPPLKEDPRNNEPTSATNRQKENKPKLLHPDDVQGERPPIANSENQPPLRARSVSPAKSDQPYQNAMSWAEIAKVAATTPPLLSPTTAPPGIVNTSQRPASASSQREFGKGKGKDDKRHRSVDKAQISANEPIRPRQRDGPDDWSVPPGEVWATETRE